MKMLWRLPALCMAVLTLSACGWFGGEKEAEPSPLVDFDAEAEIEVLWSQSVGEGLGSKYRQLSPAFNNQHLFVTDKAGHVFAFDKKSGAKIWDTELGAVISSGVGVGFGQVAIATENGELILLNSTSGEELWRTQMSAEVISAPQFNDSLVVVQSIDGKLTAFNIADGKQAWVFDAQIPNLTLRGTGAPIVTANVTFAGFSNGKLVAIDNATGNEGWARQVAIPKGRSALERIVDLDGRMLLSEGMLYIPSYQGRLAAINPYNAQVVWTQDVSSYRGVANGFGNVYLTDSNDGVQAFDQRTSASVWLQPALTYRQVGSPLVVGDYVLVTDMQGYLHVMSQVDGRFVARRSIDSAGISADMAVSDDIVYVISNDGRLEALTVN